MRKLKHKIDFSSKLILLTKLPTPLIVNYLLLFSNKLDGIVNNTNS